MLETCADPAARLRACGFAALHFAACCEIFVTQNFDFTVPPRSFAALEDDRRDCSLRMTLGVTVRFAQDDADGDGVVPAEIQKDDRQNKKFLL